MGMARALAGRVARRFSIDVGWTRVSLAMDSLCCGVPAFGASPLIVKSDTTILADLTGSGFPPWGEIRGAAENCAGREPSGTTGIRSLGFRPTTATFRLDAKVGGM